MIDKIQKYFFQEKSTLGISLFRVLLGSLSLIFFIHDAYYYQDIWGTGAIELLESQSNNFPFSILNIFQYFSLSNPLLLFFIGVQTLTLISFTLGYRYRISSILATILLISFHQRNINILSSADLLQRIFFILMVFAPTNQYFSIQKFKNYMAPPWIHRLIQIQISLVYIMTVIAKLKGSDWIDGSALYYATRITDLTNFPVPFILDSKLFLKIMTWSGIIIEALLGISLILKKPRIYVLTIGILFHLSIEYMMHIPIFEWLMVISLVAMLNLDDYPIYMEKLKKILNPGKMNILYFDGYCTLCNSTIDYYIQKDKRMIFKYSSLQSSYAKKNLASEYVQDLETVVFQKDNNIYKRSDAILVSFSLLRPYYKFVLILLIIPTPIRDYFYKILSKNRYKWFKKRETCRIPSKEEQKLFLN